MGTMIKNDRQYRISKDWVEKFEQAIASLEHRQQQQTWSKLLQESYESHIAALRSEIAEYETLKAHSDNKFAFGRTNFTVDKIAQFLIKARIAAKISPAELASLAQIPVEKITEYERNNYESASFLEVIEVAEVLGVNIQQAVVISEIDNFLQKNIAIVRQQSNLEWVR
ncbi:MAG: helix-turn-helix transcriptional regulator [Hormoscilla sp. GM7CHS1pb]|nr:helix-turn-helix transcriptional regulator [Hormoscilla sp. GM7CHS1pb]